ncbi:hypothetical protein JL722_8590 [Aureococcus anophagefferens]|nr:hypothetical protein JL722_8590 [Aureococcus anophagefferens]
MLRGLVVVAAVVAQVRDAPSGYRAGKPSGANAFALYDACNSSLRALVAAGAKARSLDAIVACETVACACDGSGAPPDCPDKAKGRRYANHVIDRVFRRVLPRLEPLPDGRAVALDDLVFFGLSVLTSSPYPFLHYDQDWTLFPDAAGFQRTLHMSDPRPHLLRDLRERPPDRLAVSVRAAVKDADGGLNFWPGHTSAPRDGPGLGQDRAPRGERAEAVNSTKEMRHQLREMELKVESHRLDGAEESRLRSAYERLASEAASRRGHARGGKRSAAAGSGLSARRAETTLRARRVEEELDEAQRNGATP